IFRTYAALGSRVAKGEILGAIASPFGDVNVDLLSPTAGIVIGKSKLPLVNEGDARFHIARFQAVKGAAENVEFFTENLAVEEPVEPMGEQPII
ncbi:MAG: succinylglutamate desuccinylase, partial [Candidatus Thiodiazotropha sp.]